MEVVGAGVVVVCAGGVVVVGVEVVGAGVVVVVVGVPVVVWVSVVPGVVFVVDDDRWPPKNVVWDPPEVTARPATSSGSVNRATTPTKAIRPVATASFQRRWMPPTRLP